MHIHLLLIAVGMMRYSMVWGDCGASTRGVSAFMLIYISLMSIIKMARLSHSNRDGGAVVDATGRSVEVQRVWSEVLTEVFEARFSHLRSVVHQVFTSAMQQGITSCGCIYV